MTRPESTAWVRVTGPEGTAWVRVRVTGPEGTAWVRVSVRVTGPVRTAWRQSSRRRMRSSGCVRDDSNHTFQWGYTKYCVG